MSINKQQIQALFAKNFEEDRKNKPQQHNKDDVHKQERQKKRENNTKRSVSRKESRQDDIQFNTAENNEKHQYINRKARDNADLQRLKRLDDLRSKSARGDQVAQRQLQQAQKQNVIRKLQGERLQENEEKILKHKRQMDKNKERGRQKWAEKDKSK